MISNRDKSIVPVEQEISMGRKYGRVIKVKRSNHKHCYEKIIMVRPDGNCRSYFVKICTVCGMEKYEYTPPMKTRAGNYYVFSSSLEELQERYPEARVVFE